MGHFLFVLSTVLFRYTGNPEPDHRIYNHIKHDAHVLDPRSEVKVGLHPGGDSHLEISVIPVLRHSLYTCKYSHGARAWQGFVAIMSM
jgi:hypothetical protein